MADVPSSSNEGDKSVPWDKKIDLKFSELVDMIAEERMNLAEERQAFEKEKQSWNEVHSKLSASQLGDVITLNVGRSYFACSVEMLQKIPDTYFSGLASGRWELKDKKMVLCS